MLLNVPNLNSKNLSAQLFFEVKNFKPFLTKQIFFSFNFDMNGHAKYFDFYTRNLQNRVIGTFSEV